MQTILIVAMGRNREIGRDGAMPWHLPGDLAHFQRTTKGHALVMGRRTFESCGALPHRRTYVVSRTLEEVPERVHRVGSLPEALEGAREAGEEALFLCGGRRIYEEGLELADRLVVTWIDGEFEADTFFPEFSEVGEDEDGAGEGRLWRRVSEEAFPADERNPYSYTIVSYEPVGESGDGA